MHYSHVYVYIWLLSVVLQSKADIGLQVFKFLFECYSQEKFNNLFLMRWIHNTATKRNYKTLSFISFFCFSVQWQGDVIISERKEGRIFSPFTVICWHANNPADITSEWLMRERVAGEEAGGGGQVTVEQMRDMGMGVETGEAVRWWGKEGKVRGHLVDWWEIALNEPDRVKMWLERSRWQQLYERWCVKTSMALVISTTYYRYITFNYISTNCI